MSQENSQGKNQQINGAKKKAKAQHTTGAKRQKGKSPAHKRGKKAKRQKPQHTSGRSSRSVWRHHSTQRVNPSHLILRTKRNDFPVGAAYAQTPPTSDIYLYIYIYVREFTHICAHICIYIYTYIYIYTSVNPAYTCLGLRSRAMWSRAQWRRVSFLEQLFWMVTSKSDRYRRNVF